MQLITIVHAHMVNMQRFGEKYQDIQDLLADINDQQSEELKEIE